MKRLSLIVVLLLLFSCKKEKTVLAPGELPDTYSNKTTGSAAHDILSGDTYQSIVLEIQYTPGYQPEANAVTNLQNFIKAHTGKSSVQVNFTSLPSQPDTMSLADVKNLEAQYRTVYTSGSTLGLYIMMVNSGYSQADVLGIAYRSTSLSLFGKTIFARSGGTGQKTRVALESTVLEHELGHLMGLVNITTTQQTQHEDTLHGNHCINKNCLMYYASETGGILLGSTAGKIPDLDTSCIKDLVANGGK